jgi:hypothetical protein
MQLRELSVDLEQEDDAAGFLGVMLERDPETGLLEMKQTGLIKRVIKALGLDNGFVKGNSLLLNPNHWLRISTVKQQGGLLATSVLWVCFYIYLDTSALISLLLSIVVLNTCSVLNICTS